jgi:hypothetical protein
MLRPSSILPCFAYLGCLHCAVTVVLDRCSLSLIAHYASVQRIGPWFRLSRPRGKSRLAYPDEPVFGGTGSCRCCGFLFLGSLFYPLSMAVDLSTISVSYFRLPCQPWAPCALLLVLGCAVYYLWPFWYFLGRVGLSVVCWCLPAFTRLYPSLYLALEATNSLFLSQRLGPVAFIGITR